MRCCLCRYAFLPGEEQNARMVAGRPAHKRCIPHIFGYMYAHGQLDGKTMEPPPERVTTIGLELEGNWDAEDIVRWLDMGAIVKDDQSLRGADRAEINTHPYPLEGTVRMLARSPLRNVRSSQRAGTHIWVKPPRDMMSNWAGLNALLRYAYLHEGDIFQLLPRARWPTADRQASGKPMSVRSWACDMYRTKESFLASLYGMKPTLSITTSHRINDRIGPTCPGPISRTWWLNMHAAFSRKAIEWRMLHATGCHEVVTAWCEWCYNVTMTALTERPDGAWMREKPLAFFPFGKRGIIEESVKRQNAGTRGEAAFIPPGWTTWQDGGR